MIAGLLNNSPVVICTVSPLIFLGFGINKANGLCCYKETSCDKYLFFGSTKTPIITIIPSGT
jgi:hypothetical protein